MGPGDGAETTKTDEKTKEDESSSSSDEDDETEAPGTTVTGTSKYNVSQKYFIDKSCILTCGYLLK